MGTYHGNALQNVYMYINLYHENAKKNVCAYVCGYVAPKILFKNVGICHKMPFTKMYVCACA